MRFKQLQIQIEHCLERYPDTRNNDINLTIQVWSSFYAGLIHKGGWLLLENLHELPTQDAIRRIRAVIQNDKKKFLPTNVRVAKKRGYQEEDWRKYLGLNPEMRKVDYPYET